MFPFLLIKRSTLHQLLEEAQETAYQKAINDARSVLVNNSDNAYRDGLKIESRVIAESSAEISKLITDHPKTPSDFDA
jgi:hypothetical protein